MVYMYVYVYERYIMKSHALKKYDFIKLHLSV